VALERLKHDNQQLDSRAMDWVAQASEFWGETLSGRRSLTESTTSASSRTDLFTSSHTFAKWTPSVIPYEYGSDYYYFLVALIRGQSGQTNQLRQNQPLGLN